MKKTAILLILTFVTLVFTNCEKEIDIDLPEAEAKLVVEGSIEPNSPPIVILTRAVGYFEPTDLNTLNEIFVEGADVRVNNGTTEVQLQQICASQLPDSLLPILTDLTGITEADLQFIDYCVYTTFDMNVWGEVGKTYDLTVDFEEHHLESSTNINPPNPLDSLWFQIWANTDSLGFIWAKLTDPPASGNSYRWSAKRINLGPDGNPKDASFIAPFGSVVDDQFFNGLSFEFAYDRGEASGSQAEDDQNEEEGFFKTGDTVVVRFSTIDRSAMEFIRAVETQQISAGNPFAAPTSIPSNVEGGLGLWVGYSPSYDTVACYP